MGKPRRVWETRGNSMKPKVEFIRNPESDKKCYICDGSGGIKRFKMKNDITVSDICTKCEGTGIFVDNQYIMIATDEKGNKIAFDVDGIK